MTFPEYRFILFEKKENYAKITINRPEVMNALNLEVRKEIIAALSSVEREDQVRAIVVTGAREKAFSAGADISMFQTMTPLLATEYLKTSKGAAEKIENYPNRRGIRACNVM